MKLAGGNEGEDEEAEEGQTVFMAHQWFEKKGSQKKEDERWRKGGNVGFR